MNVGISEDVLFKEKIPNKLYYGYTKNQWSILIILSIVNICSGLAYSILAPFYPAEAEKKGVKPTQYGFVFGVYELVNFIVAPFLGMYMNKIGTKTIFNAGILLAALMTILFGFVDELEDKITFLVASFAIRILQAIGAISILTGAYTMVTIVFTGTVSTVFAIVETAFGIGLCIGPPVGAVLFQVGGFKLTFGVLGAVFLSVVPASISTLRSKKFSNHKQPNKSIINSKTGILSLLKIPTVVIVLLSVVILEMCFGVLPVLLEPHLRQFNIGVVGTGLMFLLYAFVFGITTPIWGLICDKFINPMLILLTGTISMFIGFILIGLLKPTLWLTGLGLGFVGLGYGAKAISSFSITLQEAKKNGFDDCVETSGLVSGVWTSCVGLGCFIGPSIGGVLYDVVGFQNEFIILIGILTGLILVIVLVICTKRMETKKQIYNSISICVDDEKTPLICK